ncbi:MAG: hypothetical protein KME19_24860 [Microcoleus vaginatus WJT46-NPBG5]|jgi:hypothetical protein|nr:hypothetical protein [Microcoleus vaginatus WJT46-NPBG5]
MQNGQSSALPDLKYNFHDALLEKVEVGPRREVTLHIILYSVYYEGGPSVQVRFGAITNFDSVSAFFSKIVDEESNEEEGYIRIDTLHYDKRKQSTAGKLFFCLASDWKGEIKIHCAKLVVSDIIP